MLIYFLNDKYKRKQIKLNLFWEEESYLQNKKVSRDYINIESKTNNTNISNFFWLNYVSYQFMF